jgi:hypothetical protein
LRVWKRKKSAASWIALMTWSWTGLGHTADTTTMRRKERASDFEGVADAGED